MCLIETALQITNSVYSSEARSNQAEMAKQNARLQRYQIHEQLGQETEAAAQRAYELSRAALAARGSVNATNLADRSVRAIGRAIGFELGQDKSTVARNVEIINAQAAARLAGVDISLASAKAQIGSHGGLALAMEITGTIFQNLDIAGKAFGQYSGQTMMGQGAGGTTTTGGLAEAGAIDAAAGGAAAANTGAGSGMSALVIA